MNRNLIDGQVEVYANPASGVYPPPAIFNEHEAVELIIQGRVVGRLAVVEVLPRA